MLRQLEYGRVTFAGSTRDAAYSRIQIGEIRGWHTNSPGHGWRGSYPWGSRWITPWTS